MSSDPAVRLEELQAEIEAREEALRARVESVLGETREGGLPDPQRLNEERVRLMGEIRHTKDEGEAMALKIEDHKDASELYRVAARVQRLEEFAARADEYVGTVLPEEVERIAEADRNHSDDEVAAYIKELQAKRDEEIRKIGALKERTAKRSNDMRNGPRIDPSEMNARARVLKPREEVLDKETEDTKRYTGEAKARKDELGEKVRRLRQEKSKLQVDLLDKKHKNEKIVADLQVRIRHAELTHQRDIRMCQQLNTENAALTTNAQTLLGQLNVEHYGIEGPPSEKKLLTMRKEEERRASAAVANGKANGNPASKGAYQRDDTEHSNGGVSATSSRRQSAVRPPLVAMKRTESQRQREAAVRADNNQRREDEESAARSRRQSSRHDSQAC